MSLQLTKYCVVLLSALLAGVSLHAYESDDFHKLPWSYGFYSGAHLSTPKYNTVSTNARIGLQLSSFADFPIFRWLSFRPEVAYVQKGYQSPGGGKTVLDYVEIPLTINPRFFFKGGGLFFSFGPSYGMLIHRIKKGADDSEVIIESKEIAMDEVCLHGGVGLNLDIGYNWGLSFLARYSYGLTGIARYSTPGSTADYRSRGFYFLVGFYLVDREAIDPNESRAREYLNRHKS